MNSSLQLLFEWSLHFLIDSCLFCCCCRCREPTKVSFKKPKFYCCRKTAVCNGDQLLDFSVPELVRSQSTFSTDPEVLQNCTGFTLCSSASPAVGECSAVMGFDTMLVCTDFLCVVCIRLLSTEFSTVNTGLGRPMFWKPLCLLSTPEGLATTNCRLT